MSLRRWYQQLWISCFCKTWSRLVNLFYDALDARKIMKARLKGVMFVPWGKLKTDFSQIVFGQFQSISNFFHFNRMKGEAADNDHPLLQVKLKGVCFTAEACTFLADTRWHLCCPQFSPVDPESRDNTVLQHKSCWKLFKLTTTHLECQETYLTCHNLEASKKVFFNETIPRSQVLPARQFSLFKSGKDTHLILSSNFWIKRFNNEVVCCPYNPDNAIPVDLKALYCTHCFQLTFTGHARKEKVEQILSALKGFIIDMNKQVEESCQ